MKTIYEHARYLATQYTHDQLELVMTLVGDIDDVCAERVWSIFYEALNAKEKFDL